MSQHLVYQSSICTWHLDSSRKMHTHKWRSFLPPRFSPHNTYHQALYPTSIGWYRLWIARFSGRRKGCQWAIQRRIYPRDLQSRYDQFNYWAANYLLTPISFLVKGTWSWSMAPYCINPNETQAQTRASLTHSIWSSQRPMQSTITRTGYNLHPICLSLIFCHPQSSYPLVQIDQPQGKK